MNETRNIEYLEVAPVATSRVQFVSNFAITTESDQKTAKYLVLNIAVDSNKTNGIFEIPIFILSNGRYPNSETRTMRQTFLASVPFVTVEIENLKIYKNKDFYGFGTGFSIVERPQDYVEMEDIL